MKLIKFLSVTLLILLLAGRAFAVVARDAVTSGTKTATGTTLTVSHTVTTGSNLAIVVLCNINSATVTLTATYAGAAMTAVRDDASGSSSIRNYIFRKLAPATGANDWVVTQSAGTAMTCWAISFTGVHQTTPETDHDGACPASGVASSSLTLTTATGEILVDLVALNGTASTALAAGANQTEELVATENSDESAGSRQAGADGGVMSWTWISNAFYCQSAASMAAAVVSTTPRPPIIIQ